MDRIRAGLTGLAAVFLVTAAASLLFAPDEAEKTAAAQQEPGEPLAQLGVAPGSDKAADAAREKADAEPEPGVPPLEAQPSGGPADPSQSVDPAYPSPVGTGDLARQDHPVAI